MNAHNTETDDNNNQNDQIISNPSRPIKIRYLFDMAPDHIITNDPSIFETVRAMDKVDGGVFLATALIPSLYGYQIHKTFSGFYFKFGLITGLFAGSIYAYCRSYARLTGLSIPTPKYVPDEQETIK